MLADVLVPVEPEPNVRPNKDVLHVVRHRCDPLHKSEGDICL
jgi:hypothetical protein